LILLTFFLFFGVAFLGKSAGPYGRKETCMKH
jgi:hypothetical protein